MKNTILVIFIFLSVTIYSQSDYRKGMIIHLTGDTVIGELNFQGDIENSKFIRFRNQSVDITYKPFDIESYIFENGKFYTSKIAITTTDTINVFAEYLVKGEKDLFYYRSGSGFHYLISMSENEIIELPHIINNTNIDGVNYQRESKFFIGYLKAYFSDCPAVFPEIEQLNILHRKSLVSITKEYHDITCGEGSCVVYDRRKYPVKFTVEPVYAHFYKNYVSATHVFGAQLYFWIPNSNEKLYIKTGVLFTKLPEFNLFQIPFQFEYVFANKFIKPKFDVGVNWILGSDGGVGLTSLVSAGCYVKVLDNMYVDFDVSSDLFAFSYDTKFFLTFAAKVGLCITINKKGF